MLQSILLVAAVGSVLAWVYLLIGRGGFWRADQRLAPSPSLREHAPPDKWPEVVVVVPARNESEVIGTSVASLLRQDYPGRFHVVVVDDDSTDGTAEIARRAAPDDPRLEVVPGRPLPSGWTGKLWAVHNGVGHALRRRPGCEFLLLTDADIVHSPDNLHRLVAKAVGDGREMVSLMVRLNCRGFWERLLIPPFVFFFQKLYPFPWVNDPERPEAAAAGGCLLVRRRTLQAAGGLAAIRDRLIDDCALAARLRPHGPIWLGLAEDTVSLRAYSGLRDPWAMVARTAYTQLRHSPGNLLATLVGMVVLYAVPPLAVLDGAFSGNAAPAVTGGLAWAMMGVAFAPTNALYGGRALAGVLMLPIAAMLYLAMTIDSARLYAVGRGGRWKGRNFDSRVEAEVDRGPQPELGSEPRW